MNILRDNELVTPGRKTDEEVLFNYWKTIYRKRKNCIELKTDAIKEMSKHTANFNQCLFVQNNAQKIGELEIAHTELMKMAKYAKTLKECIIILDKTTLVDKDVIEIVTAKIHKYKPTFEEWYSVYKIAISHKFEVIQSIALGHMSKPPSKKL